MFRNASLSRRLLLGAAAFIAVALIIAAVVIGFVLHRFVQGQIDQRLDSQVIFLSSTLQAQSDGTLSLTGNADGPPFDRARRGWYWEVTGPKNTLRSRSLGNAELEIFDRPPRRFGRPPPPPPPGSDLPLEERPRPADGRGPDGGFLHFRIKEFTTPAGPVTIVVSAPRMAVMGPIREAMLTLGISLGVLGLTLMLAILLQVRLGLRPLERLKRAVADVRAGRSERVPAEQPKEIQPLVTELNGLLEQHAANLERARRHVANLAHGLKTPLATLNMALSERGAHQPGELQSLLNAMDRRIRHHLGRARAAAMTGPVRARTVIAPRIDDLGAMLGKVNADKRIAFISDVPRDLVSACEQQDFDEMAGNMLENAFKWTRSKVEVHLCANDGRTITLTIEDDGAGIAPEHIAQVLRPGERLDESAPGFGFGLAITRELAELYGGGLDLGRSELGGLCVSLRLPCSPLA